MTASATEALSEGKEGQASRPLRGTRKLRAGQAGSEEAQRFFLAKPGEAVRFPSWVRRSPRNQRRWWNRSRPV